jgi:hypothetical protein
MKLIEADEYRLRYHVHVDAQAFVRSPALAVSAATSSCCSERTFTNRHGKILCVKCRQPCREREWYAPATGAHRGGGQYIRIHETKSHDRGDRMHAGMWNYIRFIGPLRDLFACPIGADSHAWARAINAWDYFLGFGASRSGSFEIAALAGEREAPSYEREMWTPHNVAVWVNCVRRMTVRRVTGDEVPGPRVAHVLGTAA